MSLKACDAPAEAKCKGDAFGHVFPLAVGGNVISVAAFFHAIDIVSHSDSAVYMAAKKKKN